ncbi:hypothetical protein [Paenibacillus sp. Mc5Re-14]|uniref:hypothetical protein n=1 Tax=Paenibacillus sp. Mc5Re-14 TaxID=1030529 RepID=UPI000AC4A341|nr:hypothetical protein [Paenibacillus sp. Mc5Re-14]
MKVLTEVQSKALFLSLLIELFERGLGIPILTEEEMEKLLLKIDEVNEGQSQTETSERTLGTIKLLLIELGIHDEQKILH